ncbi:class I SAM-dependent methyltransferase [bacterium]|nr:class I SAM-dependent methyltransferase [bacterium]
MNYYNQNAKIYFDTTIDVDMSKLQNYFLEHLPQEEEILDIGCGSGRDAKFFMSKGYQVLPLEPAEELAKLAEDYLQIPVSQEKIADITYREKFIGAWACASLLHLPYAEMPQALEKIYTALKAQGYLFLSLKYGEKEEFRNGRFFCDYTEEKFESLNYQAIGFTLVEYTISQDKRVGREADAWLNVLLRK